MTNSASMVDLLKQRRSPKLRSIGEPGPTRAQLEELLAIAARVPDHAKLVPWRFIVVAGGARARLGEVAAEAARQGAMDQAKVEEMRTRFSGVPVTVVAVSCVKGDPADPTRAHPSVPAFEQELSCGAACMNYIVAARAMGFGVVWLTEWLATDPAVLGALGVRAGERVAGFLYTGTAPAREDRPRPALGDVVTWLD
jgi:nitroreductase